MCISTSIYSLLSENGNETKTRYPLNLDVGIKMNFFLWGWVWDNKTRFCTALLTSLMEREEVEGLETPLEDEE